MSKVWAAGLWLVVVLGCNSGSRTQDGGLDGGYGLPPSPLSPLAACLQLATAEANLEVSCRRLGPSDVGDSASGYIGAQCPPQLFAAREAAYRAGTLAYNAAAVNCMVNALLTLSGSATIACNIGYPELDPACGQLAWGTLGPGESCGDEYACGFGLYCARMDPTSCGVCTADVGENDSCGTAQNGAFCTVGACNGESCVNIVGATKLCELDSAICRPPLTCHDEGCQVPGGPDAGCATNVDCTDNLSCNAFSSHCFLAPGNGQDCSEQSCALGLTCIASPTGDGGFACAPLVAGGACLFSDAGPLCPEFETCHDGGCAPLALLDGGCEASADCALGACVSGSCQFLPNASKCTVESQCLSGICDTSGSGTCVAGCE